MSRNDTRPEIAIAAAFGVTTAAALAFTVAYVITASTQVLGAALAVSFGSLAVGLTVWSRHLVRSGGFVEEHEGFGSSEAQTRQLTEKVVSAGSPHRRGVLGMLALALASLGAAAVFPLRSLLQPRGEHPTRQLNRTVWREANFRLVDADDRPIRLDDVTAETVLTAFPEGHTSASTGDVPAFLVRLDPAKFRAKPPAGDIDGVVAYSLLCTHAGCPVSLYEQSTGRMLCPCHQSVFDLLSGGRPVAGPAARSLPGLPIALDPAGFLYATGDFTAPPGPGFWSLQ